MLCLQPLDDPGDSDELPLVQIGEHLQFYLGQLEQFPRILELAHLGPGTEQQWPADATIELLTELEALERALFDRSLPQISRVIVSSESEERIDWPDLAIFCDDLRNVLETASASCKGIKVTDTPNAG